MPAASLLFVVFVILVALAFDFTNGMHDAANSIATIVSTQVLTPRQAVVWAAFFNFVAFLIFGTAVAAHHRRRDDRPRRRHAASSSSAASSGPSAGTS